MVADEALVQSAVDDLRTIVAGTVCKTLEDVGAYLLDKFYGGDVALYRSSSPSKHVSLQRLIERCDTLDFPMTQTFLSNAIGVAAYSRTLPQGAKFRLLPASHRIALLRVKDPNTVEALAEKVIEKRLPVRKVRELALRANPKRERALGRRPTPALLRTLRDASRILVDDAGTARFSRADIVAMKGPQIAAAQRLARTAAKHLAALLKLLG